MEFEGQFFSEPIINYVGLSVERLITDHLFPNISLLHIFQVWSRDIQKGTSQTSIATNRFVMRDDLDPKLNLDTKITTCKRQ